MNIYQLYYLINYSNYLYPKKRLDVSKNTDKAEFFKVEPRKLNYCLHKCISF